MAAASAGLSVLAASSFIWGNRAARTITSSQTFTDSLKINAGDFRPLSDREPFPVVLDKSISGLIIVLLFNGRPSHIALFVMTVNVDSVQSVLGRRLEPDFFEKFSEGNKTELDASTAVVFVTLIFLARTSIFCIGIRLVFARRTFWYSHKIWGRRRNLRIPAFTQIFLPKRAAVKLSSPGFDRMKNRIRDFKAGDFNANLRKRAFVRYRHLNDCFPPTLPPFRFHELHS